MGVTSMESRMVQSGTTFIDESELFVMSETLLSLDFSKEVISRTEIIRNLTDLLATRAELPPNSLYLTIFHFYPFPINRVQSYKRLWKCYPELADMKLGKEVPMLFNDAALWVSCCQGTLQQMVDFFLEHPLNSLIIQSIEDLTEDSIAQRILPQLFEASEFSHTIRSVYPFTQVDLCLHYASVFRSVIRCGDDGEGIVLSLFPGTSNR